MGETSRVFMSYKYSTPQLSRTVQDLATALMHFNIDVVLDQQELSCGSDVRSFMENSVASTDAMLVVVTSELNRALSSTGIWGAGARFEIDLAIARLATDPAFRLIPVLVDEARPEGALARLKAIDLSEPAHFRGRIAQLAADLVLGGHPGYASGLLAHRYRVDQLIERRGLTHVLAGYDTRLGVEVELYGCVHHPSGPRLLQLASRIARARSKAYSPFLLNYRDFLPFTDAYELVTERFVGPDLEVCLQRGHRLPAEQVCAQVCLGMIELHNAGLVHGGLVPQSIRIGCIGKRGAVKIVDFTFTAPDDEPELDFGGITGYPMAMPPENLAGCRHGEKGDVYQLGTLLFRCLTGRWLLNRRSLRFVSSLKATTHCLVEELNADTLRKSRRGGADIDAACYIEAIRAMSSPDPDTRPTGQEALHMLFRLGADPTGYSEELDAAQQQICKMDA
jgi:hypothetical protein